MKKDNFKSCNTNQQSIKPWRLLDKKSVFKSKWLEIHKEKVVLPDGKIIDDFYTLSGDKLVCIVAITCDYKIILVKQYRHGVKKVLWDIPGGGVEDDETFLQAAKRELAEEVGYQTQRWLSLGQFYPDPARLPTTKNIFLALDAVPIKNPKKFENIFFQLVTFSQLKTMMGKNQINELGARLAIALALEKMIAK